MKTSIALLEIFTTSVKPCLAFTLPKALIKVSLKRNKKIDNSEGPSSKRAKSIFLKGQKKGRKGRKKVKKATIHSWFVPQAHKLDS